MTPLVELPDAFEIYSRAARDGARPDPYLKVSQWADQFRILTPRSSPEPGPWRTSRAPFLRDIMDDLSPSSRTETIVFMKGAQIGGTECGNNWIGFVIHVAPGPMMSVQPTTEMAKRNSKQRIGPLIEDSIVLRERVKDSRQRDSGNTLLSKEFPAGLLVMVGANSAKGLRSMPARYLFLDEVDAYPGDVDGEGEPCSLAIARTTNFPRRKIFIVSTPTVVGRSRIERFYGDSDQRRYWMPCPHCEQMIVFEFGQLRWTPGQPQTARYYCEACARPIENHQKEFMLARGEWRPGNQAVDPRIHGYHLSSLYSPIGWLSWAQIAGQREKAGNDPEKLQTFVNTVLGQTWSSSTEVPDSERLYERREGYPIGRVPRGGLVLTCGVDVQVKRIECEIVAWGRNKESWSIDYRVFEGDTSQPAVWRNVAELLDEDFETDYGLPARIRRMAIDSGFNTTTVYDFARKASPGRVMAVKGQTRVPTIVGAPTMVEAGPQGNRLKYGVRLWPVNTAIAKDELYRWLRTSVPDVSRGELWPAGFCHFPQYSKEYFEQLCSEQLVSRLINGRRVTNWEKMRDRNEALDCRVYARAAAVSMRLEAWKEPRWADLEDSLSGKAAPRAQQPPAIEPGGPPSPTGPPKFRAMPPRTDWLE